MKTLLKISLTLSTILCLASLQTHAMNGGDDDKPKGTLTAPQAFPVTADNAESGASGAGTNTVSSTPPLEQKDGGNREIEAGTFTLNVTNTNNYSGGTSIFAGTLTTQIIDEGNTSVFSGILTGTNKTVTKDDEKEAPKK